jgi:hypothetical protein
MEIEKIIKHLQDSHQTKCSKIEILELIKKVNLTCYIVVHFKSGTPIMRGRPNKPNERFEKKSDYSYKPQCCNTAYQRASTPNNTMFYGVVPNTVKDIRNITSEELLGMRTCIFREVFHNGIDVVENPKISYGRWRVKNEVQLNVLAIIHEEKYVKSNILLRELRTAYDSFLNQNIDQNIRNNSLKFGTFLANEFSKANISIDKDYMISAIFSEHILENQNFDGVLYPSVRAEGTYFNIAIKPEAVNSKLELTDVGECPIRKTTSGHRVCKSDLNANNLQNEECFKLIEII